MFASKNGVLPSVFDALGMGVGFTLALLLMGSIREIIGAGTIFGITLTANLIEPMLVMTMAPGGFFVFGILVACANKLAVKSGKKPVEKIECKNCGACGGCEKGVDAQ